MKYPGDALWRVVWYSETTDPGMLLEAVVRGRYGYGPTLRGQLLWVLRGYTAAALSNAECFFEEELWGPVKMQEL